MNRKITGILAILLSSIMVTSAPVTLLASDETGEAALPAAEETIETPDPALEEAETVDTADLSEEEDGADSSPNYSDYLEIRPEIEVNPLYADSIDPEDYLSEEQFAEPLVGSANVPVAKTVEEFCENYRNAFDEMVVSHNYRCSAVYECPEAAEYTDDQMDTLMKEMIDKAKAEQFIHNGIPTAGDYARWNYPVISTGAYCERGSAATITVYTGIAYYTTEAMEEELTAKFEEAMSSLNLDTKTEYGKIKAIYDYIVDHVTYDDEHYHDEKYDLKFSAYAALVNGTAVCQGYSSLFYRMALEAGLDARLISGDGLQWDHDDYQSQNHGWNIVRLHDLYYNLDLTRDASDSENHIYTYFLKANNKTDFPYHIRDSILDTAEFHKQYPMSNSNYEVVPSDLLTLTPEAVDLSGCTVTVTPERCAYNGSERKPGVTVMNGSTKLIFGEDYTVSYGNNIEIGTGTVTVTGKGKCSGTVTREFEIYRGEPALTFAKDTVTKSRMDEPFVNELTKRTDGTVTFKSSNPEVATVDSVSGEVTIKEFGTTRITVSATAGTNYIAGSAYYTLKVEPINIARAAVYGVSISYGYTGKAYTPVTDVKVKGVSLKEGTDYTIKYQDNQEPGRATIRITGMGNYTGTKIKRFSIVECVSALESGKTYQLIPKTNLKMAVSSCSGKMVNNTAVYITERTESEAMRFKAVKNSDGTWKFINAKCELAIAVQQNNPAPGKELVLYDQTTRKAQNWRLVRKYDNSFAIVNAVSGLYVDMYDTPARKATPLSMEESSGKAAQRFYIVEAAAVDAPFDGTYAIKASKDRAYGLNIASASREDGANVNLYKYSNSNAGKFKVLYSGGGYYRLENVNSGLVLSVAGNTKTNGANVIQSKWQGQSGQRWKITGNSDGTVTLTNALGTVLQLSGNKTANWSNVVARTASTTGAQRWKMAGV